MNYELRIRYMVNEKFLHALRTSRQAGRGFTLLEVLTVLAVIGFMITVVSVFANRNFGNYSLQQAINDMNRIKTAIRDGFYRDTGLIPQSIGKLDGAEDHPEFATKWLCLKNDCNQEDIENATYAKEWLPLDSNAAICRYQYLKCDELCSGGCEFKKLCTWFSFMTNPGWDDYPEGGLIKRVLLCNTSVKQVWNGPYLEGNITVEDGEDEDGGYIPVIATPWASGIEQAALDAEDEGNDFLAERYRKGKYYHIHVKADHGGDLSPWPEIVIGGYTRYRSRPRSGILQDKTTARIICYGENGLDDGSYCKEYDNDGSCKEGRETTIEELKDPDFDIGDDLVMFIFGDGFRRVPVER